MLSRVAESMYWMSRYMERAENTASFLDVNFHLMLDLNKINTTDELNYWEPLIHVTYDTARFRETYDAFNAENVTDFLVFNRDNPNSIRSCVALARENARSTIESISSEMWEELNTLYHDLGSADPKRVQADPYSFYRNVKTGSQLFQGITDATLLRNEGYDFVQMGKYMERADAIARLVDVKYHSLWPPEGDRFNSVDVLQWMAVLKSCSALESFRKVYHARITPDSILEFLVLDRAFPRSILFSVNAAQEAMWRISGSSRGRTLVQSDRLIGKLESELSYTTIDDIYQQGLHDYFVELERDLSGVGEQIHQPTSPTGSPTRKRPTSRPAPPKARPPGLCGGMRSSNSSNREPSGLSGHLPRREGKVYSHSSSSAITERSFIFASLLGRWPERPDGFLCA